MSRDQTDDIAPDTDHSATALGMRELRDPRDMRALAHPTRLALLEVLAVHGPLTATQAAELVGESPSSCSFHLRTLARHNFVEETGDGRGRQRPWRRVTLGTSLRGTFDDPETTVAADALSTMFRDRQLDRLAEWWSRRHEDEPEWVEASDVHETLAWVTADELQELNKAVTAVVARYRDRLVDPTLRPEGSRPVEALYFSFPVKEWDRPESSPRPPPDRRAAPPPSRSPPRR